MLLLVRNDSGLFEGEKTHSALILIQVIIRHLEFIVWFQQQF